MSQTKIPNGLINALLYMNGTNSLAGISEVELPKIDYATVTTEQLGLSAELEVPLMGHYKKLEAKIKMDSVDDTMIGLNNMQPMMFELKGAYQYMDKVTHGAGLGDFDATFKGMVKTIDGLKAKPGAKIETSIDIACTYYKLTFKGKKIVHIDVLNNIAEINGEDNNQLRRYLGMF